MLVATSKKWKINKNQQKFIRTTYSYAKVVRTTFKHFCESQISTINILSKTYQFQPLIINNKLDHVCMYTKTFAQLVSALAQHITILYYYACR